jgi:hypothetical protein
VFADLQAHAIAYEERLLGIQPPVLGSSPSAADDENAFTPLQFLFDIPGVTVPTNYYIYDPNSSTETITILRTGSLVDHGAPLPVMPNASKEVDLAVQLD